MKQKYFENEVYDIIQESDLVRRFFFRFPEEISFTFQPGQFVMLNLPIAGKITNRSYSIASTPNNENTFELVIVFKQDGKGTRFLWENVSIGNKLPVSNPLGKFKLSIPLEEDICFIGTGTGIAPLRSMLLYILNNNIPHKNLYLVFGNRWEKDILYRKEMEDLAKSHPSFKFIPVLSREKEGWAGKKGCVHAVYEEIFSDKRPVTFYLCGWRDMLHEARQRISAMGYDKSKIKFESYD